LVILLPASAPVFSPRALAGAVSASSVLPRALAAAVRGDGVAGAVSVSGLLPRVLAAAVRGDGVAGAGRGAAGVLHQAVAAAVRGAAGAGVLHRAPAGSVSDTLLLAAHAGLHDRRLVDQPSDERLLGLWAARLVRCVIVVPVTNYSVQVMQENENGEDAEAFGL
jgi:hypothetical protein